MVACPFCNVIIGGGTPVGRVACRCGRYQIRNVGRGLLAFVLEFRSGGQGIFREIELSPKGFCYAMDPDGNWVKPADLWQRMRDAIDQERVSDILDS